MTIARITLVFAATPLLACCGGNTGIRQGEPTQPAQHGPDFPIVCPPEPESISRLVPIAVAILPECYPVAANIPYWSGGCSLGKGNTLCIPIDEAVYLWDPSRNCKKQIRFRGEDEYECYDTGIPFGPNMQLAYPAVPNLFCRERADGSVEVLRFGNRGRSRSSMKQLGWIEGCRSLCPSGRECPFNSNRLERVPDCS